MSKYPVVNLSYSEIRRAELIGMMRNNSNIINKRPHINNQTNYSYDRHIQGAASEMALAKKLGIFYYADIDDFPIADLSIRGFNIQVRSTTNPKYCLTMYDNKDRMKKNQFFFLLIGEIPTFKIMGWMQGIDGMTQKYWKENRDHSAYFIPQKDLEPYSYFEEMVFSYT
jgi:hypothetical protein